MAGIGFILRKLMRGTDLTSLLSAYFHSVMASTGPWIATIIALGSFFLFGQELSNNDAYLEFRLVIMFNFSLSLVIASPIMNCSTRYLADLIYLKQLNKASGLMIGMLCIIFIVGYPAATIYYFFFTNMYAVEKIQAVLNFMLISSIWHAGIFISALKYYKVISISFVIGLFLSVFSALYLAPLYSMTGMLVGFNLGLGFILASLIALVFVEYPPEVIGIFKVVSYFKKYWEIGLGFFLYSVGLWIDKWIMWFAPESVRLATGMRMYPDYDSAMFISYLTVIPAMANFLLAQETTFYESYFEYYEGIHAHDNLEQIKANHNKILDKTIIVIRNLLFIQIFFTMTALILAPYIFQVLGINLVEIGIFRAGVLGAGLQILSLFITVLLSYFDFRMGALIVQTFFLVTNGAFTYYTMRWGGFATYGYGFFAASLLTFILSIVIFEHYVKNLPFHTFVTQNIRKVITRNGEERIAEEED